MLNQTIGENVKIIGRPDSSNWPVAIKTSSGIHLVEAPLSPRWTRSVINAVQNEFPGEDIISVIPTHTHYDHFGGIREIAAEVDKIYIPENSRSKLENALSSTHTLVPDAFSNNSNMPLIENVTGITYIDNGAIEIHILKLSDNAGNSHAIDNSHSEDIVVVYVPEYNVLIQADFLYAGIFLRIWNNEMVFPFTGVARTELSQRAQFLVNYIGEKNLNVDTIIGIHGGKCTMEDLINVAQN
jgi:glyoxylase-like metal-dependent hydrolase (beta-lactamase superfamily II)